MKFKTLSDAHRGAVFLHALAQAAEELHLGDGTSTSNALAGVLDALVDRIDELADSLELLEKEMQDKAKAA